MVEVLKKEFADYNLTYSIGGQISFDVFPKVRTSAADGACHTGHLQTGPVHGVFDAAGHLTDHLYTQQYA